MLLRFSADYTANLRDHKKDTLLFVVTRRRHSFELRWATKSFVKGRKIHYGPNISLTRIIVAINLIIIVFYILTYTAALMFSVWILHLIIQH